MSPEPISHSPDLKQLRDEGYDISIENSYLVVRHVPYVTPNKEVAYGTLISALTLQADVAVKPQDHVVLWSGEYPCRFQGAKMENIVADPNRNERIDEGLVANFSLSQKGEAGYDNYYQKMTRYIQILENEAHAIDPSAMARTYPPVRLSEEESVFCYLDNASSRAGVTAANDKLKGRRIAIVGLGGTGSYVLDLVAKTPVDEIHLFDGDSFQQHNAFRSPGAPSFEDLAKNLTKVEWFAQIYSRMRRKILAHPQFVDEGNVADLKPMDFVFLCIEGARKKTIVDYLIGNKIPFIDVGIGMYSVDDTLGGNARVTTSTPAFHDHLARKINYDNGADDVYSRNIQIADMNALNAALAVIKWKKLWRFYVDFEHEHDTTYGLITNVLTNGDIFDETKVNQT